MADEFLQESIVKQDELGCGSSVFIVQVGFPEVVLGVAVLSVAR